MALELLSVMAPGVALPLAEPKVKPPVKEGLFAEMAKVPAPMMDVPVWLFAAVALRPERVSVSAPALTKLKFPLRTPPKVEGDAVLTVSVDTVSDELLTELFAAFAPELRARPEIS